MACAQGVWAQKVVPAADSPSVFNGTPSKVVNNLFQQALNSIKKSPGGGGIANVYQKGKSEKPYRPYQGKVIRRIIVETFNFDRSFYDTTVEDNSFISRMAKRFHYVTREGIVRDNLFIKEGTPLNAYKVADNERYLRTLEYLQDARIVVKPIRGKRDSVDLIVYTKDLFSIAGSGSSQVLNHIVTNIYETNLAGMGQRVEVTSLYDKNRDPTWGYGLLYRKNNVNGSFIDATAALSKMSANRYTNQEETAEYLSLSRRLISPYSKFAGAVFWGYSKAINFYKIPDADFFSYRYQSFDAWVGYNIAVKRLEVPNIRDRKFIALRYYNKRFEQQPVQVGRAFDPFYNNTRYLIGQITLFRQDYYKAQYIYGFGATEDLPYGYNVALTAGWHQQQNIDRPYVGLKATYYITTDYGDFAKLYFKSGVYRYHDHIQDGSILVGATVYSRLFFLNSTKIRYLVNASFTGIHNRVTTEPLMLNNFYGLRGFLSDSIYGTQRWSLQLEAEFYIKPKLYGFKFAPFPYADISVITPQEAPFSKSLLYSSIGGGVRARNENLVFETIEMRAYYFPLAPVNMAGFKIIINSNIRFRYSSNYVTAPDLVQLNEE